MIDFIKSKLRYKIMFFLIVSSGLTAMLTLYMVTENIKKSNLQATQKSLEMLNLAIFQNIRTAMQSGDMYQIAQIEEQSRNIPGVERLEVAKSSSLIALFGLKDKYTTDPEVLKTFDSKKISTIEYDEPNHHLRMIKPMIASSECLQCHTNQKVGDVIGIIDLTFSLEESDAELHTTIVQTVVISVFFGILTIYLLFLFLKKSTAPLEELEEGIKKLSQNDQSECINVKSSDEIGSVALGFNKYLQKIRKGIEEDNLLLDEAQIIIDDVKHGVYDKSLESDTSNPSLQKLKISLNEMIASTNGHLTDINKVLDQYSKYDFDHEVVLENIEQGSVTARLVTNINNVRESVLSQNLYLDKYVIMSRTDLKGIITYASQAFCDISGYTRGELLGQPHNIVRHQDMPKEAFADLWNTIRLGKVWQGIVKNKKKNGEPYWTFSTIGESFDGNGNLVGYTSTRQDITPQKESEFLAAQMQNILDNANDGFLTFNRELKVKEGASKRACEILDQDALCYKDVDKLLFKNCTEKIELFRYGVDLVFDSCEDKEQQDLLISLLPNEHKINDVAFLIHYKVISDNELMVILEDVTARKDLEKAIEYENKTQKMIVVIATRKYEFLELKHDFERFLDTLDERVDFNRSFGDNLLIVTQLLHTFKGLFAQEELVNITQEIHNFESMILEQSKSNLLDNKQLHYKLTNNKLKKAFEKDLDFIAEILGDDFLEPNNMLTINQSNFKKFEDELLGTLDKNHINKNDFKLLVNDFLNLNQRSLKNMLQIYPKMVKNMSKNLNKDIHDMQIVGDPNILVQWNFNEFIKSLVHVFRNMIDHGIEDPYERIEIGKEMHGTIKCSFSMSEDGDSILLKISDNGKGIDADKIAQVALQKNLITQEEFETLSREEKLQLVFKENISTKQETNLISGRGIGLNAVKHELDKIGGEVSIESFEGIGTKFLFRLPSKLDYIEYEQNQQEEFSNCIIDVTKTYLQNNLNLNINELSTEKSFVFYNHYSVIKFSGNNEIISLISCEDSLLRKMVSLYMEDGELTEELFTLYANGTIDETLNTMLGHSIPYLPYEYKDLTISPPLNLDKQILESMFTNNENIIKKYVTPLGCIYSGTIFLNKTVSLFKETKTIE